MKRSPLLNGLMCNGSNRTNRRSQIPGMYKTQLSQISSIPTRFDRCRCLGTIVEHECFNSPQKPVLAIERMTRYASIRDKYIAEIGFHCHAQQRYQANEYLQELNVAVCHAARSIREEILETRSNEHSCLFSSHWSLYHAANVCCAFSRLGQIAEHHGSPTRHEADHSTNEHFAHFRSPSLCYEGGPWNAKHRLSVAISRLTDSGRDNSVGLDARYQAQVLSFGAQEYLRDSRCRKLAEMVNVLAHRKSNSIHR